MLGMFVHAPDLTEVGQFYYARDKGDLLETEAALQTQFAFATTIPGQAPAEKMLRDCGWRDMGHRYNQFHGPNFITLWFKEFPKNTKPAKAQNPVGMGYVYEGGPKGIYSCGIWVENIPDRVLKTGECLYPEAYLKTKFLAIMRAPGAFDEDTLAENGWHRVGTSALGGVIWHTAEPHDVRDKHLDYKPAHFYHNVDTR